MSHHDESSWGDVILISFSLLDNTTHAFGSTISAIMLSIRDRRIIVRFCCFARQVVHGVDSVIAFVACNIVNHLLLRNFLMTTWKIVCKKKMNNSCIFSLLLFRCLVRMVSQTEGDIFIGCRWCIIHVCELVTCGCLCDRSHGINLRRQKSSIIKTSEKK